MTQEELRMKHEAQLKNPVISSFVTNENGRVRFFTEHSMIVDICYEKLVSMTEVEQLIKTMKQYAKSLGIKLSGINKKSKVLRTAYEHYERTVEWINNHIRTLYECALAVHKRGLHIGWSDDIVVKNMICNMDMITKTRENITSDYFQFIQTYQLLKGSYDILYGYLAKSCEVVFDDGTKLQLQFSDQCDTGDCDASIDYTYNDKKGNEIDGGQVDYSTRKNPYHTIQQTVDMVKDFIFDNKKAGEWVNLCGKTVMAPRTLCVIPQTNRNSYMPDIMYV